uniref:Uncharacterized protein n=1 Tax=Ascaris lumbricoides TaxID=6252 RepID=A0A0M3IR40_ASCLU
MKLDNEIVKVMNKRQSSQMNRSGNMLKVSFERLAVIIFVSLLTPHTMMHFQ